VRACVRARACVHACTHTQVYYIQVYYFLSDHVSKSTYIDKA